MAVTETTWQSAGFGSGKYFSAEIDSGDSVWIGCNNTSLPTFTVIPETGATCTVQITSLPATAYDPSDGTGFTAGTTDAITEAGDTLTADGNLTAIMFTAVDGAVTVGGKSY